MKSQARELYSAHFSRISIFIVVLEATIISFLAWWYIPLGFYLSTVASAVGGLGGLITTLQALYWGYHKFVKTEKLSNEDTSNSKKGIDSSNRVIADAFQTTDQQFDNEVERIIDWMRINEEGDITLVPTDDIQDDPLFLLYVVAAKVAFELDMRDSPAVSLPELDRNVETTFPAYQFIGKADEFLTNHYSEEERFEIQSNCPEELRFEINADRIKDAVSWIERGTRNVPTDLRER